MTVIPTERLLLRPLLSADLPEFVAYRSDPDVARYQGWDATFSMADATHFLDQVRDVHLGQPGKWLQLAAVHRVSGALCGDVAVRFVVDQPATAEIGVTFARGWQGVGLAREALSALLAVLFGDHGAHRVYAEADDRNGAVHHLLERLGFRCEARLVDADWVKGEWTTLRTYALLDHEWTNRRSADGDSPGVHGS